MPEVAKQIGVNVDFLGNRLLQKGEESISADDVITPASITTDTNNYNPTNLQTASVLRIASTGVGNTNITGIVAPDTARNKQLIIINVGSQTIILANANANSLAANRFEMNHNIQLNDNEACIVYYDQLSQRWRAYGLSN